MVSRRRCIGSTPVCGVARTPPELVECGVKSAHDLRTVGAVPDDLGERERDQPVNGVDRHADTYNAGSVDVPTAGIGPIDDPAEEIGESVDDLHRGRRIVDGG